MLRRRGALAVIGGLCGSAATVVRAAARASLPDRGLTIFVGFIGGGGTDIAARLIAVELQRRLGRRVVVQNRPGAAGAYAGKLLAAAPPDGATVAFMPSTTFAASLATKDFPFDPLTGLAPISLAGTFSLGFAVSRKIGVSTFAEYLDWARAGDDRRRRLGNTASNAFIDVLDKVIGRAVGLSLKPVAYNGAYPMVRDLEDGRLPAAVSAVESLLEHHRGGRLKLLLTSSASRLAVAPDIPTARELGYPDLQMDEWFGLFAPPTTPPEVVEEWSRHIRAVLAGRDMQAALAQIGLDVETSTPAETLTRMAADLARWKSLMEEAGMTPVN